MRKNTILKQKPVSLCATNTIWMSIKFVPIFIVKVLHPPLVWTPDKNNHHKGDVQWFCWWSFQPSRYKEGWHSCPFHNIYLANMRVCRYHMIYVFFMNLGLPKRIKQHFHCHHLKCWKFSLKRYTNFFFFIICTFLSCSVETQY